MPALLITQVKHNNKFLINFLFSKLKVNNKKINKNKTAENKSYCIPATETKTFISQKNNENKEIKNKNHLSLQTVYNTTIKQLIHVHIS
jgi:hypothetical protein